MVTEEEEGEGEGDIEIITEVADDIEVLPFAQFNELIASAVRLALSISKQHFTYDA